MKLQFSKATFPSFGSFSSRLVSRDRTAEEYLVKKFSAPLIRLIRARTNPRYFKKFEAEDVIQLTFMSFFDRHRREPYDLESWDCFWALLSTIALRKLKRQLSRYHAAKRDVNREISQIYTPTNDSTFYFWQEPSREPNPREFLKNEETADRLLQSLTLMQRKIVKLRLEKYSIAEIAVKLNRTERTIYRALEDARFQLNALSKLRRNSDG